jgi:mannose-binding lectin 2
LTTVIQARGIRNAQIPTKAKFTYFQDKSLKLELQYKAEDEWTECFDIPNFKIPPVAYLGFSAETGELSDNHDIISVKTLNLYQHNTGSNAAAAAGSSSKGSSKPYEATKKSSGGSWTWFFMKFVLFGLAVTGAYVGFTIYRARQRDRF